MAARDDQDTNYDDPEEQLRRRVKLQVEQQTPAPPDEQVGGGGSSPAPAPFNPEPTGPTPTNPPGSGNPFDPNTPPYVTPGQPVAAAPSAAGNPNDPGVATPPGMKWDPNVASFVPENIAFDPTGYVMGPNGSLVGRTPAAPTPNDPSTGAGGDWTADRVRKYFASRGVTPYATSPDYWASKWNEWGKNDPAYFMQRLAAADEFTGKPPGYVDPSLGGGAPRGGGGGTTIGSIIPRTTTGSSSGASGGSSAIGAPAGLWGPDFVGQLRALLLDRIRAASGPVDEQASGISQALTGARDEATRATDRERTQLAERLYAQGGLNTDAINQSIQQSGERNATELGGLRARLIQREVDSRKQELRDLMQMALAAGDAEAAREIQLQISELNAILQREGYGVTLAINEANQNANAVPY